MIDISVHRARLGDLRFVDALRRKESESIGFLPTVAYEWVCTGKGPAWTTAYRLWIAESNADQVGFLYLTPGKPSGAAHVAQVCIQRDARRLDFASALVTEAERHATATQRGAITLRVAQDLEARDFWEALGYPFCGLETGGTRRGRVLERRRKLLPLPEWANASARQSLSVGLTG